MVLYGATDAHVQYELIFPSNFQISTPLHQRNNQNLQALRYSEGFQYAVLSAFYNDTIVLTTQSRAMCRKNRL